MRGTTAQQSFYPDAINHALEEEDVFVHLEKNDDDIETSSYYQKGGKRVMFPEQLRDLSNLL